MEKKDINRDVIAYTPVHSVAPKRTEENAFGNCNEISTQKRKKKTFLPIETHKRNSDKMITLTGHVDIDIDILEEETISNRKLPGKILTYTLQCLDSILQKAFDNCNKKLKRRNNQRN